LQARCSHHRARSGSRRMSATRHPVLTIGHSTHSLGAFVALLKRHGVTALADVRSVPYSRFNPQFNREALEQGINAQGIKYVFLGPGPGGRSDRQVRHEEGRVPFAGIGRSDLVRWGIGPVIQGPGDYRIALMCAEKEPLECHRTLLVARALTDV